MQKTMIAMLVGAVFLTVFTLQNPNNTDVKFMGWQSSQIPLIIVIVGSLSFGAIISMLMGFAQTLELKKTIRRLENELSIINTKAAAAKPVEVSEAALIEEVGEIEELKSVKKTLKEGLKT